MKPRGMVLWITTLIIIGATSPYRGAAGPAPVDPMRAELAVIAASLDTFWSDVFADNGLEYRPPQVVYEPGPLQSACAGETWFAAYCPIGEALHIDPDDVATRSERYGAALPAMTLAHEWTHHVLTVLYRDEARSPDIGEFIRDIRTEELLADCQAGAFLVAFWPAGSATGAAVDGLHAFLADNGSDVHGTPEERIAAFDRGFNDGLAACGLFPVSGDGETGDDL